MFGCILCDLVEGRLVVQDCHGPRLGFPLTSQNASSLTSRSIFDAVFRRSSCLLVATKLLSFIIDRPSHISTRLCIGILHREDKTFISSLAWAWCTFNNHGPQTPTSGTLDNLEVRRTTSTHSSQPHYLIPNKYPMKVM